MNALKKQLKLPSGFPGMKKAESTSNLSDKNFLDCDTLSRNTTFDGRFARSKSPSINAHDLIDILNILYNTLNERPTDDFLSDDLPTILSTEWLNVKNSTINNGTRLQRKNSATLELLTTELNYLNQMQFLLDVKTKIFSNVQQNYFSYINVDDVFLNLGHIYEVNHKFWTRFLYPSYENAKENDSFISCEYWKDGFNQISTMFSPYQEYCSRLTQCQKYIQSLEKDKYFSQFLQWFSRTDQSNRESLSDFIAKPFQRLTKYKLLLTTINGYSDDIDDQEDLSEMIDSINIFLKQVEWKLSIAQISVRMEPIEFVEAPTDDLMYLCSQYRQINLAKPMNVICGETMRQMIKEGTFKMKEAQTKVAEVSLILFTDFILICQKIKNFELDRIKVIRPIIPLSKLDIISPVSGSMVLIVLDDFCCLAAMYLLTNYQETIIEWIEAIQTAQLSLKNINAPKSTTEKRLLSMPTVNVINPSPVAGRSPTPSDNTNACFNRYPVNGTDLFIRSPYRSSPIVRRQNNYRKLSHKSRTESLDESRSPTYETMVMNRSISQQHYSRSQLSVLDDDNSHQLYTVESSESSIEVPLHGSPIFNGSTNLALCILCDGDVNKTDDEMKPNCSKQTNRLIKNRAYGSMVNMSMNI